MIPTPSFQSDRRTYRTMAALIALVAGVAVYALSVWVFPHHSINHDEAVYLQQAATLLEGRLFLRPPVPEALRPWFFVRDGARMYPKYAPVPAALFAAGKLLGGYRLALSGIAAGNAALTYAVAAEAFDRRTGALAAALLVGSPLFLVDSAVFLPYAPTTLLNLLFAFAYFRSMRSGDPPDGAGSGVRSRGWAALAGAAVGLAFFARPYTAVLFAAPFVLHALWTLPDPAAPRRIDREALARRSVTAAFGLAGVAVTLGYNAVTTGSPFLFPYQAFAPLDGPGFGRRAILGYERTYTPALALRANAEVLGRLFARWVVAGPLGTALALVGLGAWLRRIWAGDGVSVVARVRSLGGRKAVLAGPFVTVPAGNVYFWGNLNLLGALAVPDDGLVVALGPYYHFDLLVPTAAFAAAGALALADRWRGLAGWIAGRAGGIPGLSAGTAGNAGGNTTGGVDARGARSLALAGLLVGAAVLAGAGWAALDRPVEQNRAASAQLDRAYAPFEGRTFRNAVVFLPTPYGDWLGHPFQELRNDPGYDGPVVYAVRERQFAVVDAFPDRRLYRYTYRGAWAPTHGRPVTAHLQRVRHVRGEPVRVGVVLGIPTDAERVSVRLATDRGSERYALNRTRRVPDGTGNATDGTPRATDGTPDRLRVGLWLTDGAVRIDGPLAPGRVGGDLDRSVPLAGRDRVTLTVFVDYGAAGGFTYRLVVPVAREDGTVRALTPYAEVCRVAFRCGGEAAHVPAESAAGVSVETSLSTRNGTAIRSGTAIRNGPGTGRVVAPVRSPERPGD